MDLTHITGDTQIGDDVFISVLVATTNENALGARGPTGSQSIGPKIGDGALIAAGANVLPGRAIGKGAVVAAGAVVTRDVAANEVVAGVPARALDHPLIRPVRRDET
ncbi:MAG: hypothetical protein IPI67_19440 [Myxococcales bacterium]|nr:hypothetical protein [Myxococcales bacterium]